jgi:hypothetical protein
VVTEDGGEELRVGDALKLTMRAEGCYSSSCTRLISADCNAIGSGGKFYISGFMCLGTDGDACTDDCGGAPIVPCDLGMTLEAGEYSLSIAPNIEPQLRFHVPSRLPGGSSCISPSDG